MPRETELRTGGKPRRRSERDFISRLRKEALRRHSRIASAHAQHARNLMLRQGIGDDCAVLSLSKRVDLLVTTDLFLEGIHFRRAWQEPASVGHKALARSLSDIAAMGGTPRHALLSLAIPKDTPERWIAEFFRGFFRLAEKHGVSLDGGDTSASPKIMAADVVLIGEVPAGKAVLRSGARPGDELWVTGALGGAARGLAALRGRRTGRNEPLLRRLLCPEPRIAVGALVRRGYASAMIDISDGLSIDLARLCEQSGVGARLEEGAIPRAPEATMAQALHGGEDLELLFTVPQARSRRISGTLAGVPVTRIGTIVAGKQLRLVRSGKEYPLPVLGFQHF